MRPLQPHCYAKYILVPFRAHAKGCRKRTQTTALEIGVNVHHDTILKQSGLHVLYQKIKISYQNVCVEKSVIHPDGSCCIGAFSRFERSEGGVGLMQAALAA